MKFHASRRSDRNGGARVRWRHFTTHAMPKLSAYELIKVLEEKYDFVHNDPEDYVEEDVQFCDLFEEFEELFGTALFFNFGENRETSHFDEYEFIRRSGWSLVDHPLEVGCWILYPTDRLYTDNVLEEEEKPFSF